MRLLLQRSSSASVVVDSKTIANNDSLGILALVGLGSSDTLAVFQKALDKICNMRIFSNEDGRFDKSLIDIGGPLLLVPQFTLFADTRKGRRPEFFNAMHPREAKPLFNDFVLAAKEFVGEERVQAGEFGADMKVSLCNDGPVTIWLEVE